MKNYHMNGSVILIDDDEDILDLVSECLLEDFNVMEIGTDGLQAVNLYEKLKPDFVIMDIAISNYDGLHGLEHIKKIDSNASVIVLTGNSDESITQKIMQLEPTVVLEKPCPVEKLVSLKIYKESYYILIFF